jgi:hypothetical protein
MAEDPRDGLITGPSSALAKAIGINPVTTASILGPALLASPQIREQLWNAIKQTGQFIMPAGIKTPSEGAVESGVEIVQKIRQAGRSTKPNSEIIKKLVRGAGPEPDRSQQILDAIEKLEPGRGNYVWSDDLKSALKDVKDEELLKLAREGKLVLGAYDGPIPPPATSGRLIYDTKHGNVYIGVARPRIGE